MSNLVSPQGYALPQRKAARIDIQQALTANQVVTGTNYDAHNCAPGNRDAVLNPAEQPIFDLLDFVVVFRAPTTDAPTGRVAVEISDTSAGELQTRVFDLATPSVTHTASTNTFNVFQGQVVLVKPFFKVIVMETKGIATQYVTVNWLLSSR